MEVQRRGKGTGGWDSMCGGGGGNGGGVATQLCVVPHMHIMCQACPYICAHGRGWGEGGVQ